MLGRFPEFLEVPFHSVAPVNAVKATRVLTVSGLPTTTHTVTIGSTVYTWKETAVADAYDVLIGADAEACIDNLVAAITAGSGAGTAYGTGTLVHPQVTAAKTTAATMTITAYLYGTYANLIALAENDTNTSWAGATMTGGVDGTPGNKDEIRRDSSYIYVCIAANNNQGTNWRRISLGSAY